MRGWKEDSRTMIQKMVQNMIQKMLQKRAAKQAGVLLLFLMILFAVPRVVSAAQVELKS